MNPHTVLAAVLGAGTAVGLLLTVAGWRRSVGDAGRSRLLALLHGARDPRRAARAAGAVGVGVLTGVLTGWVVGAILAAAACVVAPRVVGRDRSRARMERIEGIATWAEMLRDTLAAAAGLRQAILATAPLAPAPIAPEITALAAALQRGEPLPAALRTLGAALADPTGDLVIAALIQAAERQAGHLTELLATLAGTARAQVAMRQRIETGRARARTSVRVIVLTTLVFAGGLILLNRPYLAPFDTVSGQLVLALIAALFVGTFWWMGRITRIPEPSRLVPTGERPGAGVGS